MAEFWINTTNLESPIRQWDRLILGGITFPGLCKLQCGVGVNLEVNPFQEKPATDTDPPVVGISLIDKGYKPATLRAVVAVWTKEQWGSLEAILPAFSPRSGNKQGTAGTAARALRTKGIKGRDAFDIVHPATALLGIQSVIIESIELPPIEEQTLYVTIGMIQYFPTHGIRTVHGGAGEPLDSTDLDVSAGDNVK